MKPMYLIYGFEERIRGLMADKDITTSDLARRTNIARSAVSDMIAMKRTPSVKFISRAARVLETTTDYLIDGK